MVNMSSDQKFTPYHPKYWPAWLIIGLFYLLCQLPFNLQIQLGKLIGSLMYCFGRESKTVSKINLALCLPTLSEKAQKKLIHQNFQNMGIAIFEMGMAWWASKKRLKHYLSFKGAEHVKNAQAAGQAVILSGAHFTSLQLIGRLFSLEYDIAIIYRQHKNPFINYLIENLIYRHYAQKIERDDVRGMLRVLKNKGILWFPSDVDVGKRHHAFVPFFGTVAATTTAPSILAKRTNTVVLPVSFYRTDSGKYTGAINKMSDTFPSDDPIKDMEALNQITEMAVKKNPAQYLWTYKRFKTRPNDEPRFY